MTAALLASALALAVWPGRRAARRRRVVILTGGGRAFGFADVPVAPAAALVAAGAGGLVGTPLVALLAGIAAFLGARLWLAGRRAHQTEQRAHALTQGLAALAADLRAGRSVEEATDAAATACGDPASAHALVRALRSPGTPAGDEDAVVAEALDRIRAGVLLSARTGCSLAAVAGAVEDELRARRRQREELRAAIAAPRASATLLAGLPVLGLAMGSGVGADPWGVLTTTGVGQLLLVAGVGLEIAGIAWSGRLARRAVR